MSVSTNDKAIRLKHIGTAFTSFITNVLAPIVEQVSGNTSDIETLEGSIPENVSDLNNDSGYITNSVNDLTNYYTTANTYTKTEVDNLVSTIPKFEIKIVNTLPTGLDISTSTIYLVPSSSTGTQNMYTEYVYTIDSGWEILGSQSLSVAVDSTVTSSSTNPVSSSGIYTFVTTQPVIIPVNPATTPTENGAIWITA